MSVKYDGHRISVGGVDFVARRDPLSVEPRWPWELLRCREGYRLEHVSGEMSTLREARARAVRWVAENPWAWPDCHWLHPQVRTVVMFSSRCPHQEAMTRP